jgi:hypothetical protein
MMRSCKCCPHVNALYNKAYDIFYGNRFSLMFKKGMQIVDVLIIKSYAPLSTLSNT